MSRLPGIARIAGRRARSALRDRAHAIVDAVELERRLEFSTARSPTRAPGRTLERKAVVVERQCGDRRAVVGLRVFDAPADGVRLPDVPGVVADDVARDALHAARGDLAGRSSIAARGSPVVGPMRYGMARAERFGSPPPTRRRRPRCGPPHRAAPSRARASESVVRAEP